MRVRVIKIDDLDREHDLKVGDIGEVVEDIDPILVTFDRVPEPLYHYIWLEQVEIISENTTLFLEKVLHIKKDTQSQ